MTRVAGWDGDGEIRDERRRRADTAKGRYVIGLIGHNRARLAQAQAATGPWAEMDEPDRLEEVAQITETIEHLEQQ